MGGDSNIEYIDIDSDSEVEAPAPSRPEPRLMAVDRRGRLGPRTVDPTDTFDDISAVPPPVRQDRDEELVNDYYDQFSCGVCSHLCPSFEATAPRCGHVCCRPCWDQWAKSPLSNSTGKAGRTTCPTCRKVCRVANTTGVEFVAARVLSEAQTAKCFGEKHDALWYGNRTLEKRLLDLRDVIKMKEENLAKLQKNLDQIHLTARMHNLTLD
ncbi:hypothetical protein FRC12_022285 [Ceratobasidium sp. 428]|nr:hypothetical protein FRC12_022285 [Ceratobasidium sp. 428]